MSTGPLTVSMAKQALVQVDTVSLARTRIVTWLESLSTENIDRVEVLMKMSYNMGVADGKEPS